ncbi:MAG: sporulation protein YabP [Bacilli bacterium]|nr:sporulation protein YabP [Bacilli bacterium]
MDKDYAIKSDTTYNHSISINDRKTILISGVKKIDSFDNEEFLMETSLGYVIVKGENLEIIKLDTYQGNVSIKGKFNSLNYVENTNKKDKEEGVFGKLFK